MSEREPEEIAEDLESASTRSARAGNYGTAELLDEAADCIRYMAIEVSHLEEVARFRSRKPEREHFPRWFVASLTVGCFAIALHWCLGL